MFLIPIPLFNSFLLNFDLPPLSRRNRRQEIQNCFHFSFRALFTCPHLRVCVCVCVCARNISGGKWQTSDKNLVFMHVVCSIVQLMEHTQKTCREDHQSKPKESCYKAVNSVQCITDSGSYMYFHEFYAFTIFCKLDRSFEANQQFNPTHKIYF